MKVNPYALAGFTGALRTGVERFQQGKAQQAAAESEYQRQLDDENRRFQRDMGLARFRNDLAVEGDLARIGYRDQLEDRAWNPGGPIMPRGGRFAPDGGYIQEGLAGTPEAEFGGLPGTWDVAPEGREYRREREKREAQAARDQRLFTQRQQLMQMRGPRGSRGSRPTGPQNPQSVDGMTIEAKRKLDALHAMNNSWNEQLKNTEESDPSYQSILKTMEENRNKAQAIVNDPASWAQPAPVAPVRPTASVSAETDDETLVRGLSNDELNNMLIRVKKDTTVSPDEYTANIKIIQRELMRRGLH